MRFPGNIVAILDSTSTAVVQYKYDAWGRQIGCDVEAGNSNATALSTLNPFRYRGYVYDEETGLYYLRSRYYAALQHRFLNSDSYLYDKNLYTYCNNFPVTQIDPCGEASVTYLGDGSDDPVNNIMADDMALGGGGYHVDLSVAARSSVCGAPLQQGLWTGYFVNSPATYALDLGCSGKVAAGCAPVPSSTAGRTIPQRAFDVLNHLKGHGYSPMTGYKGGKIFSNDGRDASGVLPSKYGPFKEFDIDPKMAGRPRNAERIVVGFGDGGAAWYTPDHYGNFYLMEEGFIK